MGNGYVTTHLYYQRGMIKEQRRYKGKKSKLGFRLFMSFLFLEEELCQNKDQDGPLKILSLKETTQ